MELEPPYVSVLVLNIGAKRGPRCPADHWLYIPRSRSGFYRVGFYSHVDSSFAPERVDGRRVAIYVESAYANGRRPSDEEVSRYEVSVVRELKEWGFIEEAEVVDPTWIDVAYTWAYPGSRWRETALEALAAHSIDSVGRYGAWRFQGIAESIREGLEVGAKILGKVETFV
jgi:protoporphyrinogen oxidase